MRAANSLWNRQSRHGGAPKLRASTASVFCAMCAVGLLFSLTVLVPQSSAQLLSGPKPCDLVIRVRVSSVHESAPAGLTVQLRDGLGSMEGEQRTDGSGMVLFHTMTGIHQVRITGPGIQEYTGRLEFDENGRHVEYVQVQPAEPSPSPMGSTPGAETVPAARLAVPEKAHSEFQKGSAAVAKKDWTAAQEHFEAAISIYANYDVAYNGLGVALIAKGNSQGARQAFEKAIHLNDRFAEACRNLARISFGERKYEEADALLVKSLDSDPLNAWALTYAAYSELLTHKFAEAIAHARAAHEQPHAGLASVHIVAARALEATQQPGEALAQYQLYLKEDPGGADAARAHEAVARLSKPAPR